MCVLELGKLIFMLSILVMVINTYYTSGEENHLCRVSLRASHKIPHAHGYHHMHQWHMGHSRLYKFMYSSMSG